MARRHRNLAKSFPTSTREQTKNVTIVHGQALVLNDSYPESWRATVAKGFVSRGIEIILGDYLDDVDIKEGYVTTRSGKRIKADLVVSGFFVMISILLGR